MTHALPSHSQDQMAFDKLHEGIKKFAEDGETLKDVLKAKLS